jgi:hypothetical protein
MTEKAIFGVKIFLPVVALLKGKVGQNGVNVVDAVVVLKNKTFNKMSLH